MQESTSYTANQIAEMFGVTKHAVHKAIQRGRLQATLFGSVYAIKLSDAIAYYGRNPDSPPQE